MFQFYVELASVHGIPAAELTAGMQRGQELLTNKRKWYDWDEHVALMDRFELLCGGREEALDAMRRGGYRRIVRPFTAIASYLTTARGVYWAGYRWFAPWLYRHLQFSLEDLDPTTIRHTVLIPEAYKDCPLFLEMWGIAMASAPLTIGLPESQLETVIEARKGVYTIHLPLRRNLLAKLWSWLRAVFRASDVVDEISEHQLELRQAYEQLLSNHVASEAALRRSEQTQRALVESLPDLVVLLQVDGTVQDVKGSARHRLAEALRSLIGRPLLQLGQTLSGLPQDLPTSLMSQVKHAIASGAMQSREFSVMSEDQRLDIDLRISPLDSYTVLCVARDISEKSRLEKQLVLADRMASLGTLAAAVAHEINNPLACVIANVSVTERALQNGAPPLPPEAAQWLREANEAAERIREIVGELRKLSRPDDRTLGPVDVNALLDSILRLTSHPLRHRTTVTKAYGKVRPVLANEGRLGQVFVNLFVNAAQAMGEDDVRRNEICVTSRQEGEFAVVEIQDNGRGIAADVLPRIFDPFFTTKPLHEGTGLGLSICHRIVTELGGQIEAESTLRKGSRFRVRLPLVPSERPVSSRPPAPQEAQLPIPPLNEADRRRILIIDDNPRVGLSLKLLLQGHDVEAVDSGEEGVRRLLSQEFDLVLCDLMMPVVSGVEVFRRVKEERPGLESKIIFMTGGAFTPEARAFLESIHNRCLEKPFREEQLARVLASPS
jgi:signal transduction histidine kinase